jgi:hypothetical protein
VMSPPPGAAPVRADELRFGVKADGVVSEPPAPAVNPLGAPATLDGKLAFAALPAARSPEEKLDGATEAGTAFPATVPAPPPAPAVAVPGAVGAAAVDGASVAVDGASEAVEDGVRAPVAGSTSRFVR